MFSVQLGAFLTPACAIPACRSASSWRISSAANADDRYLAAGVVRRRIVPISLFLACMALITILCVCVTRESYNDELNEVKK